MPDLRDGESVEIKGSASRPYTVKNVAGVYSCSCPAWRNQSLPIERRTCKHIRSYRGDTAEESRLGGTLSKVPVRTTPKTPPLLLAESWDGELDPTGWHLSEKLDGVRAYWDGRRFLSRQGNCYHAPAWFTKGLPLVPLDGELWIGRKLFQRTVSVVRRHDQTSLWEEVRFLVFDAPGEDCPFEERLKVIDLIMGLNRPPYALAHQHELCEGIDHLQQRLRQIESQGGEGLMLRQPGSFYEARRSNTLLKVKTFKDAEAIVVGHDSGSGRHKGRLGALLVELGNGVRFNIGTGFSDKERQKPPPIGSTVTFKYQELTDGGVPRFPSYVRTHRDQSTDQTSLPLTLFQGEPTMAQTAVKKRRFEFVEGSSDKFWELGISGTDVEIRYGRNGTQGQSLTKSFVDEESATKHADKLIREKTGKGYVEVAA